GQRARPGRALRRPAVVAGGVRGVPRRCGSPDPGRDVHARGSGGASGAVALAREARAGRLVLFHHEPEHSDEAVDALLHAARREARARGGPAEVLAAEEGTTLTL